MIDARKTMPPVMRIKKNERRVRMARYGGAQVETIADPAMAPLKNMRVGMSTIAPGTSVGFHYHSVEAVEILMAGRAIVRDASHRAYPLEPGDAVVFAPGPESAHAWEHLEGEPSVIVWMHPGPGEDQITWVDVPPPAKND